MEYEIAESDFVRPGDVANIEGISLEILDEVKDVSTDYGLKAQCTVKVSGHGEKHEKKFNVNTPTKNYLINKHGKESKKWIGATFPITTKTILGNLAIVPKI